MRNASLAQLAVARRHAPGSKAEDFMPAMGARQFTSAFANAAIGMAIVAPDSRRLRVNRAFCEMLGYSEAEMLVRSVREITHPDDLARDLEERKRLLAGEKDTYQREKRYLRKDGSVVWGHLTCTLVRDDAGRPLHFISQVVDISERRAAQQQLHEMQALLHMAAQIGRLGAWAWDCGSHAVTWSPEVCAIHDVKPGYTPTIDEALYYFAPAHRLDIRAKLRKCVKDGTPFDTEAQVITARGRKLWVRVICEAEWDADGKVRRIQGACQDITAARRAAEDAQHAAQVHAVSLEKVNTQLEARVQERTAQLEAANRELEAFSYSIAHDLRAPLSSIDGFSKCLEQSLGETPGRTAHYLNRIRAGVRQMGELTDGLLALASLSRAKLRNDDVDLALLARRAVTACREASPGREVEATVAGSMHTRGDARLLAQVMGNLVGNAWKFTSRTHHARIEIGSETNPDGAVVYFVRDNGAGFDMAYADRMFEAFQRMHSAAEFDGTGIGLALVRKIVERHGGRIWAQGAPGLGATFRFTLQHE